MRIDIPPSVRVIKDWAFYGCSGLTTAILNDGDGLEEIGKWAFSGCALVHVEIPPSVKVIENYAFHFCSGLTTAIFNNGLEVIEEQAFQGCALVRIDIPHSVKVIRGGHSLVARTGGDWGASFQRMRVDETAFEIVRIRQL